ncbi:MAG: VWA domain-containing protein [Flavobacteriaceae bacterium]|nr:VWA domain-containing protein [Flavobacteriaceae bacterium]
MSLLTILYIVLAVIIAFMVAFFQYFYKNKYRNAGNILLAILRFFAVFTLLLLLINPKIKSQQLIETLPTLNVVVDNSSSIAYTKQGDKITKLVEELKNNTTINKKFDVNYYVLTDDLYKQDTFSFDNSKTNILKALQTLASFNRENIAPTILITDGNQTYGSSYEFYKSNQQLYPVAVGDTLNYDDLKINQINVNSYTSLTNKFPVEVFLEYDGNETINKILTVKQRNNVVFKKQIEFSNQDNSHKILFHLPANTVGMQNYKCTISTLENEKNTINNVKNFSVEVIDEQAKILIVSDINHPDISMLKRSIESNKQRKVFVENNLSKKLQLKDYQLVILYQPTKKFTKIFNTIKDSSTNLFVITGTQTDWDFLNASQQFFTKNKINKNENYSAVFNPSYDEFITEDIGFNDFYPLEDYFGEVTFSVPYKTILYQSISSYSTENPLLVTFTDNNRRGAVLFGENSWKWRMFTNVEQQSFEKFDIFFNKLIQYLSSNKRSNQLEITYKPFIYNNNDIIIGAQFFDATYTFDSSASLLLTLTNKTTKEIKKLPFTLKNNAFEVVLNNLNPGNYNFMVSVDKHNLSKRGNFTVSQYDIEQQFVTANTSDLRKIANASEGNFFYINETDRLLTDLLSDKRYVSVQKSTEKIVSLIEWKWLLSMIILFFSLEWFIRKYRGLI